MTLHWPAFPEMLPVFTFLQPLHRSVALIVLDSLQLNPVASSLSYCI